MASDLENAVERLSGMPATYEADWNVGSISFQQVHDLLNVYKAYIREHDPTPVSDAWLDENFRTWSSSRRNTGWELLSSVIIRHTDSGYVPVFSHTGQGPAGAILRNRGQVRQLCSLLGIGLPSEDA